MTEQRSAPSALQDMLNPEHYANVRQPPADAQTLPPWCYTSDAFYQHEVEQVLLASWHCVGRTDRLPVAGDHAALDIAGVPIILWRGADMQLRAFANSCRHRGTRLLKSEGCSALIRCPFHGWAYHSDGRLAGATHMDKTAHFSLDEHGLLPVRMETHSGFVFVNISGDAPPLSEHLGDFSDVHGPYAFEDMVTTWRREYHVECNWKLFIQVFMEYYHLPTVHGETFGPTNYQAPDPPNVDSGEYISFFGTHDGAGALLEKDWGESLPPIGSLSGRLLNGSRYTQIFPGTIMCSTRDCMWFYECCPEGPERSTFILNACFPAGTAELPGFAGQAEKYYARWDAALQEDIEVLQEQQRGMASPLSRPGRLSHLESAVGYFERWLTDRLIEPQ